jgi:hypothetical protein
MVVNVLNINISKIDKYLCDVQLKQYYCNGCSINKTDLSCHPMQKSQHSMASMNYFDSDMYNSTNTVVYSDEKDGTNNAIAYWNFFFCSLPSMFFAYIYICLFPEI